MINATTRFDRLQALRAFAALLVVADHSILSLTDKAGFTNYFDPLAWAMGGFGVSVFFALSGFVMAHTTRGNFQIQGASQEFFLRRIWRIVPLYWVVTAIYAVKLFFEGNSPSIGEFVQSLLFIPYLNEIGLFRPVTEQGWTLNFEMYFYALFAVALVLPRTLGLLAVCVTLCALVAFGAALGWAEGGSVLIKFISYPMVLFFIIGIGAYTVFEKARSTSVPTLVWWLATTCLFGIGVWLSTLNTPSSSALLLLIVGATIYVGAKAKPVAVSSPIERLLILLGDASYSIYLTHNFLTGPAARVWAALHIPSILWPLFVLGCLVAASIAGVLVHLFIEKPILSLLRPLFGMRPPKVASV